MMQKISDELHSDDTHSEETHSEKTHSEETHSEGWESLAEDAEGSLAANPELEEALREAAEAVEGYKSPPSGSADSESSAPELSEGAGAVKDGAGFSDPNSPDPDAELIAELVEMKDRMLRHQAEFDNFRKRALKERQEALQYGHQNLVKDLLSAVDNLDRALEHSQTSESGDLEGLLQGVKLVQRELLGALGKHGVTPIEAMGVLFDPNVHEAMVQAPDDSVPENTVIEVFEVGYMLRDRLIRPARVVVAKAPADKEDDEEGVGD